MCSTFHRQHLNNLARQRSFTVPRIVLSSVYNQNFEKRKSQKSVSEMQMQNFSYSYSYRRVKYYPNIKAAEVGMTV